MEFVIIEILKGSSVSSLSLAHDSIYLLVLGYLEIIFSQDVIEDYRVKWWEGKTETCTGDKMITISIAATAKER